MTVQQVPFWCCFGFLEYAPALEWISTELDDRMRLNNGDFP